MTEQLTIAPFEVRIAEDDIRDLRHRLARTIWPDELPDAGWDYGAPRDFVRDLCAYWEKSFDFDAFTARLNAFDQFITTIDGQDIHFYHIRSPEPHATPLLVLHGWPGSVVEYLDVMGPLSDPRAHGLDPAIAFHLVIPSLPGFGFSGPTGQRGFGPPQMGALFARLMAGLGYGRYAVQGGDWGAVIATFMGSQDAAHVTALHLNLMMGTLLTTPPDPADPDAGLSEAEKRDVAEGLAFRATESGYQQIQATKPQTLAYGLTDSPAGLAAWIGEKFRGWSDCGGNVYAAFTRDQLLANISLYWFTRTINASTRVYYEFTGFGRAVKVVDKSCTPAPVVPVPVGQPCPLPARGGPSATVMGDEAISCAVPLGRDAQGRPFRRDGSA